jgi:hypothetical protein
MGLDFGKGFYDTPSSSPDIVTINRFSQGKIGVGIKTGREFFTLILLVTACPFCEEKIFIRLFLGNTIPFVGAIGEQSY